MAVKKTIADIPYAPPAYRASHAAAFQALQRGDAEPHQQQEALKWLIEQCAGAYQSHYYQTDRDTAFALGRAFVGQQTIKLLNLDLAVLRKQDHG